MHALPQRWYHGSPYCCMETMADFEGHFMFITDSKHIAREYTKILVGAGKRPVRAYGDESVVYELSSDLNVDQVFDTRRNDHLQLFFQLAKESQAGDPDDGFRKTDLMRVHPAAYSRIGGEFPSYGIVRDLLPRLVKHGFTACFIAEGTQGASLAVWNPQAHLQIVNAERLGYRRNPITSGTGLGIGVVAALALGAGAVLYAIFGSKPAAV